MSSISDEVAKAIREKSVEEGFKIPEPTEEMKRKRKFEKVKRIAKLFGLFDGGSSSGGHVSHPTPHHDSPSHGGGIRDRYRHDQPFDPERAYIDRMQWEAYHDLVDGKGDHDCDHDH